MTTIAQSPLPDISEPDFSNTGVAYAYLDNKALNRSYRLFQLMKSPTMVTAGSKLALWALKTHIPVKQMIRNTLFKQFCGGETLREAAQNAALLHHYGVETVLDYAAEGAKTEADQEHTCQTVIHNIMQAKRFPGIHYVSLKITGLTSFALLEKLNTGQALSNTEEKEYRILELRLDSICRAAMENGVCLYIDAEESWIQKPIDELALTMMERYNISRCVLMNTFQMYRTDRLAYISQCISLAEKEGFIAGIKIVRGAYLEKEQHRAAEMHYPCPVFTRKEDTDHNFNAAIELAVKHLDNAALCIASHNEHSTALAIGLLKEKGIRRYRDRVLFSQLYGMSDNITFNLAKMGLHASKYLPYGPVEIAMPYLIRRAQENTSVGKQTNRELNLLSREIQRRKA